jgi:ADP-heptose:LPS heptosyltransferase
VRVADAALAVAAGLTRSFVQRPPASPPRRILLLRIERIGDLVMTLDAIRDVRALAPDAEIDLVVGSWNHALAAAIPVVDRVVSLDAAWLAREGQGLGVASLLRSAWSWRDRRYDLAINFEPDVRSNLLAAASGAARTVGWKSGGGGPVLDIALDYDTTAHTSSNARRLVRDAFSRTAPVSTQPLLALPDAAIAAAGTILAEGVGRRLIGVHVNGGRAIKQWEPKRFAEVAATVADSVGGTIVATGSPADRPLIAALQSALGPRSVIDASRASDLLVSAAILSRLDVFITGDTGPMHVASAVGTPVVAIFGPSDPVRYATRGDFDRVVRVDLPCSPCNRIRRPPSRCVGHTPDCLTGVSSEAVIEAALSVLGKTPAVAQPTRLL